MMHTSKRRKAIFTGILLLVLSTSLYSASRQEIESAIELARKDLRISIATEERITSDLAKLNKSGHISPDITKDYDLYLIRVQAMVAENRKMVGKLEALHAKYYARNANNGAIHTDDTSAMLNPEIPEEQIVDEVTVLDRQLDNSLAEFDEMLLEELDLIRAKSSDRLRDLAEEAAAAAKRLRDKGIDINTDYDPESDASGKGSAEERKEAEKENGTLDTGKENESGESRDDSTLTVRNKSREGTKGSTHHPGNRYDPKDDDIVARQLREAAERETDPELKKKLWKEYEQYKKNVRK